MCSSGIRLKLVSPAKLFGAGPGASQVRDERLRQVQTLVILPHRTRAGSSALSRRLVGRPTDSRQLPLS